MSKAPTLVVMGTARNVAKHSASNVATMLPVIVFENDSTDDTLAQLRSMKLGVDVDVISESGVGRITDGAVGHMGVKDCNRVPGQ